MLQGLLPLSTAGLALLGASYTARGATAGLILLAAAALILLWSDVRLLLVGLSDFRGRARAVTIAVYPLGSMATCVAAVGGLFLLGSEPLAPVTIAAITGGTALRLLVGVIALALTLKRLPPGVGDPLREALAFR